MKKKMLAVLVAALAVFNMQIPAGAVNASKATDVIDIVQNSETILANIDADTSVSVKDTQILYNLADNPVAVMYYLDPEGYIIADDHGRIVQYSLEDDNTFFVNPDAHYCYTGALGYIEKVDGTYIDLTNGNSFTPSQTYSGIVNAELDYTSDVFWEKPYQDETQMDTPTKASPESISLDHATRPYNCNHEDNDTFFGVENSKGVCGPVALAIMTAYMDDYHDDNFCDNTKKTNGVTTRNKYGRDLVLEIIQVTGTTSGTEAFWQDYQKYLDKYSLDYLITAEYAVKYMIARNQVLSFDRPCMLGVQKGTIGVNSGYKYEHHWVTVIGVSRNSSGNQYFHVNTGFGQYNENGAPLTDRIADVANLTALYYLN